MQNSEEVDRQRVEATNKEAINLMRRKEQQSGKNKS